MHANLSSSKKNSFRVDENSILNVSAWYKKSYTSPPPLKSKCYTLFCNYLASTKLNIPSCYPSIPILLNETFHKCIKMIFSDKINETPTTLRFVLWFIRPDRKDKSKCVVLILEGGGGVGDRGSYFIPKIITTSEFVYPKSHYFFSIPQKIP